MFGKSWPPTRDCFKLLQTQLDACVGKFECIVMLVCIGRENCDMVAAVEALLYIIIFRQLVFMPASPATWGGCSQDPGLHPDTLLLKKQKLLYQGTNGSVYVR